jgi:hypothetical protein
MIHSSKTPVIQRVKIERKSPPILLCILERSFTVNVGEIVTYESSNFGDVLIGENSITLVERVQKPNGQRLTAMNLIPESDRILVYQIGNGIEFHSEPITIKQEPTSCWWMGSGIYNLHYDRVWRSDYCTPHTIILNATWFETIEASAEYADSVINAQNAIQSALYGVGLPLRSIYTGITQEQRNKLVEVADLWHLAWSWSEQRIKRRFQQDRITYLFNWSYRKEN